MRKNTILWLILGSILLAILGAALYAPTIAAATSHCTQEQISSGTCKVNTTHLGAGGVFGLLLWIAASLLGLIAWIMALVRSATMHSWVWFVLVLLFSGLGTLVYALFGPKDRPKAPAYQPPTSPTGYPQNYPPPPTPPPYPQTYPQDYSPTERPPAMG